MKITTKTEYVSNDGTVFENSVDCIYHESKVKPLTIKSDSNTLSNLLWDDSACSDYKNIGWAEYIRDKECTLQSIYDILATEDKEKRNEFFNRFDYYELVDVIQFLGMIRIDVESK